jgi:hypothetical protein
VIVADLLCKNDDGPKSLEVSSAMRELADLLGQATSMAQRFLEQNKRK